METNVMGLQQGWNKIVWDSQRNGALLDFYTAPAATKYMCSNCWCKPALMLLTRTVFNYYQLMDLLPS